MVCAWHGFLCFMGVCVCYLCMLAILLVKSLINIVYCIHIVILNLLLLGIVYYYFEGLWLCNCV